MYFAYIPHDPLHGPVLKEGRSFRSIEVNASKQAARPLFDYRIRSGFKCDLEIRINGDRVSHNGSPFVLRQVRIQVYENLVALFF
jgi:hypothetical protein